MDQGKYCPLEYGLRLLQIKKRVNNEVKDAVIKMWLYHRSNTCRCGQL